MPPPKSNHQGSTSIILGLDPGTTRIGFGLIKKEGNSLSLIECGVMEPRSRLPERRLLDIKEQLDKLIKVSKPDLIGLEELYFSKNKKTALAVSEARGVMRVAAMEAGVPVLEFNAADVKRAVAGDGHCDKKTLARMVCLTLGVKSIPGPDDASDALAIAIRASFNY